jgi:predicted dehydrogenase
MPTPSPSHKFSRRTFLGQAAATGATIASAPVLLASDRAGGANARISIGLIGSGGRGTFLLTEIQKLSAAHNAEVTALCDVWRPNRERGAAMVKKWWGRQPRTFTRFGDLLALGDLDAVVIATPDFAHCPILVAALEAGKDAYVEKPMAMEVATANRALDLARAKNRVVQAGTQRRSEGRHWAAANLLASGILGRVSRVTCEVNFNEPRWARPYDDCKQADVDWDAYLFNRPKQPFDPRLLLRWHLFKLCTNGLSGLWMSHYVDAVHLLLGATYPASAVAHGGTFVWNKDRQHADTFHALLQYPENFLMSWGMGLGNSAGGSFAIHGTAGTLDVDRWNVSPAGGGRDTKVKQQGIPPAAFLPPLPNDDGALAHMANWLECIRSRRRPRADIQYGHQHAVATIMAAAAYESGRRQVYDRAQRHIVAG